MNIIKSGFVQWRAALAGLTGAALVGTADGATVQQQFDLLAKGAASPTHPKYAGGARYDGVTDDSNAHQACLDDCLATGKVMVLPAGTTYNSKQILKAGSFKAPVIRGAGPNSTIWKYDGVGAAIKVKGGSGALTGAYMSGIGFQCLATNYAVEVADQCGYQVRDCRFIVAAVGILLHNESAGGFTEFVSGVNCTFESGCKQALVYKRTGGNDSFHGSGLVDYLINEDAAETVPKVEIGGALSTSQNIIVYNAPMSGQAWKHTAVEFIRNNSTRYVNNVHGIITFEVFGGNKFKVVDGANKVYSLGGVKDISNCARRGSLQLVDGLTARADGSIALRLKPFKVDRALMVAGANNLVQLPAIGGETYEITVTFTDSGSPWRRVFVLHQHNGVGQFFVKVASDAVNYYGGNQPDPVFSMGAGNVLVATQAAWPADRIQCDVSVVQIGFNEAAVF